MSFQILQRAYAPYGTAAQFPASGDSRLIYRATDTGYLYTWDASESAYKLAGIDPATAPYLGLHAQADDAARLGGQLPSYYAQAGHVHNYAGSSSAGGAATSAEACTGNAATATTAASCTGNSATATTASSCSGNAATATKLATARTLTIGSKANTFDGSADKAWTLAEIGAIQSGGSGTLSSLALNVPLGSSSYYAIRIATNSAGPWAAVLSRDDLTGINWKIFIADDGSLQLYNGASSNMLTIKQNGAIVLNTSAYGNGALVTTNGTVSSVTGVFTGSKVIGGTTYNFVNGLLVS